MPREWKRSGVETLCGACDRQININEPVMTIRGAHGAAWKLLRCGRCAGEPVPDDLPIIVERAPIQPRPLLRTGPGTLPLDWKQKQLGEKE